MSDQGANMSNPSIRPHFSSSRAVKIAAGFLFAAAVGATALAQAAGPKSFATPKLAADALVQAAEANDTAALKAIFGPAGKAVFPSGDPVADKNRLTEFARKAREKMEVSTETPKRAILLIGNDAWPMPIPLVQQNGSWHFDAHEGQREILARRIGGNELDAIKLLRGYVEAQHAYASVERDGSGMRQYAQKFLSSQGKHDGLCWRNEDGKPGGPFGDEIAKALAAGYTNKADPYNGYYFRILTGQGPAARLGSREYVVKGMMIGGFAAIAWPANYGQTGIQTFLVNNDGVVYQKDLGADTAKIAPGMKRYNPDKGWLATEDAP
jgi:hypothetical protein